MKVKRHGIIIQVAILFLAGTFVAGIGAFFIQRSRSNVSVRESMETVGAEIAEEVAQSVKEYPAYEWLLMFWYEHGESMSVEYDVDYVTGIRTETKLRGIRDRYPSLELKYAKAEELDALPFEDQLRCAEVCYSWLITRINQIKRSYNVDYLFIVVTDDEYRTQFFLLSGADEGAVRGRNYEEVYPLGIAVTVGEDQHISMQSAIRNSSHMANAGDYMDYYSYLCDIKGLHVLTGMTYNLSRINSIVERQTKASARFAIGQQLSLSLVCLALTIVFIIRPIRKIQLGISQYKQDKDSAVVAENLDRLSHRHSEIGILSGDVISLSKEIDDYVSRIEGITAERERMETELSLAARIQAGMLPSEFPAFPDRHEFDIFASMKPALDIGGDFYDFFLIDEDHLALLIADVSGKGIPAALFMMASKIMLRDMVFSEKTPAKALQTANHALCQSNHQEMFLSVWLGILEISTGILTAANAGHEYPVLKAPGGGFKLIKDKHGFVIGGIDCVSYHDYTLQLEPGSKLFVYTDGVPEATNAENELFGNDRMVEALNTAKGATPENILSAVRSQVEVFVGDAPQFDDLTMLCLEYKGTGKNGQGQR